MEVGDKVTYYIHEASDIDNRTRDILAIVLQVVDDNTIDVAVLPPGGPIEFTRVHRYIAEDLGQPVGRNYWRPFGEAPPDFTKQTRFSNDPEWHAMHQRHQEEWDRARQEDRQALKDKHKKEWDDLYSKLDQRAKGAKR